MKNIFKYILIFFTILIPIIFIYFLFIYDNDIKPVLDHKYELRVGGNTKYLAVADTTEKQNAGLSNIDDMSTKEGMLFIFNTDQRFPFWMKDVKFNLDMIFMDKEMKVNYIFRNALPCGNDECSLYVSPYAYRYVIELKGGEVEKLGIKVGDVLEVTSDSSQSLPF